MERLPRRIDKLLLRRIKDGLLQEEDRATRGDQHHDRMTIHRGYDEAQRSGVDQNGRWHSVLRQDQR